jgi:glutamate-1-semialdehyde aminotransferase
MEKDTTTSDKDASTTSGLTSEQVLQLILPANVVSARGGYLIDGAGHEYLDMVSAWGANLLGYGYPRVSKAVARQATSYLNLGVAGPEYGRLEALIKKHVPSAEIFYPLKNGSDATATAVRLARKCTGRTRILHYGYHGAHDWFMAGIAVPGVPPNYREDIVTLAKLEPEHVTRAFEAHPEAIACLILDPFHNPMATATQMAEIAAIVRHHGALLVFDEVLSGFRAAPGGMQAIWGINPDLTCLGKGIANGLGLSALVGREAFMRHVYEINYSLTFRLEALPMVAAVETISEVVERDVCKELANKGRRLKAAYAALATERGLDTELSGHDSRPQLVFRSEGPLMAGTSNYLVIKELSAQRICTYGTFSLCYAHSEGDIDWLIEALADGLDAVVVAMGGKPRAIPKAAAAGRRHSISARLHPASSRLSPLQWFLARLARS